VDRIVYVDKIVEKHVNVPVPVPGPPQMIDRPVPVPVRETHPRSDGIVRKRPHTAQGPFS
jgi:hypothetical protein